MINSSEIEAVAEQLDVHSSHVQRDYVHSWLLATMYSKSNLASRLVLKGGNCLRKAYFVNGRYSSDLDFSVRNQVLDDELGRELNAICSRVSSETGIEFDLERTRVRPKRNVDSAKSVSEARLYFKDIYGNESELILSVRLDITQFDRIYLPIQERPLIHPYSDSEACNAIIRCMKLEEVLATKMRCLLQRRHIADLYDLVYPLVTGEIEVNRSDMIGVFFRITIFGQSPGVAKGLLLDLPLEALGRFWNERLYFPRPGSFSFANAREALTTFIGGLFPQDPIRESSHMFFPAALRNPIMSAADNKTLLSIRYSGRNRLVEPYSLKFKVRRDGFAREYFYGHDLTGGSSGRTGIKMFVADGIQAIENTNTPFEPRYEIELRKSGGSETVGYFEGYRRPRARRSRQN